MLTTAPLLSIVALKGNALSRVTSQSVLMDGGMPAMFDQLLLRPSSAAGAADTTRGESLCGAFF